MYCTMYGVLEICVFTTVCRSLELWQKNIRLFTLADPMGHLGSRPPKRPKMSCLPPPKKTVDRWDFFFLQFWMICFFKDEFSQVAGVPASLFQRFFVQNFKNFFRIPKSSRN